MEAKIINRVKRGIAGLLIAIVATMLLLNATSCSRFTEKESSSTDLTSVEQKLNVFNTAEQALEEQMMMNDEKFIVETFSKMDGLTLSNVANVLIKRNGCCTMEEIVQEYLINQDIYTTIATIAQPKDSLVRDEKDTIIGGTVYKKITYGYELD